MGSTLSSTKVINNNIKQNHSTTIWEVAREIFKELLAVMRSNEPGLRLGIDPECLHDYRVAIRRTRTGLSQLKNIFSKKEFDFFKEEFFWLGSITTPTRDLDVYLEKFDEYTKELPETLHIGLGSLWHSLLKNRQVEHVALCDALDSMQYEELINAWQKVLERDISSVSQSKKAAIPAKKVANKRIWKLYQQALSQGNAINQDSPSEDLHELRKTCKKLRYMMEFFQKLYNANDMKSLIKQLKQLQDNLGDFQDLSVEMHHLQTLATSITDTELVGTQVNAVIDELMSTLKLRRENTRTQFEGCFSKFTQTHCVKTFEKVFLNANDCID